MCTFKLPSWGFFDIKTNLMLDEMTVLKSTRKSKMLAAHPTILEALPFMESYISFKPFVNFLKEKKPSVSETKERLYNYLIKQIESEPVLMEHITDVSVIDQHSELMDLIATSLFPIVGNKEKYNFAFSSP